MQRHHATAWDFPLPNFSHSHHKHLLCSRSCAALQILLNTSYKLTWLLNFQSELNPFHWQSRPRLTQSFNKEGLLRALFIVNRDGQPFLFRIVMSTLVARNNLYRDMKATITPQEICIFLQSLCCAGINFDLLLCFEHHCIMSAYIHDVLLMLRIPFCTFILSKSS